MRRTRDDKESGILGLRTEIRPLNELSAEVAQSIRRSDDREFGSDPMVYAAPEWYVLGFFENTLTAHVGLLSRTITVAQRPLRIGGIAFLVTEPENRGRGIARLLAGQAVTFVKSRLGLPFALLTCKPRLETLYTGWGWRTVPGPTVFIQKEGMRRCGGLTMIVECADERWPEGEIDLCGLPW